MGSKLLALVLLSATLTFGQDVPLRTRKVLVDTIQSRTPASFVLFNDSVKTKSFLEIDSIGNPIKPAYGKARFFSKGINGVYVQYPDGTVHNLDSAVAGVGTADSTRVAKTAHDIYNNTLTTLDTLKSRSAMFDSITITNPNPYQNIKLRSLGGSGLEIRGTTGSLAGLSAAGVYVSNVTTSELESPTEKMTFNFSPISGGGDYDLGADGENWDSVFATNIKATRANFSGTVTADSLRSRAVNTDTLKMGSGKIKYNEPGTYFDFNKAILTPGISTGALASTTGDLVFEFSAVPADEDRTLGSDLNRWGHVYGAVFHGNNITLSEYVHSDTIHSRAIDADTIKVQNYIKLDSANHVTAPNIAKGTNAQAKLWYGGTSKMYVMYPDGSRHNLDSAGTWADDSSGYLRKNNNLASLTNASAARTNLGLAIGTNVQAYDADLTTYAGITPQSFMQTFLGSATLATARTNLGLGTADNVQFAWVTPSNIWMGANGSIRNALDFIGGSSANDSISGGRLVAGIGVYSPHYFLNYDNTQKNAFAYLDANGEIQPYGYTTRGDKFLGINTLGTAPVVKSLVGSGTVTVTTTQDSIVTVYGNGSGAQDPTQYYTFYDDFLGGQALTSGIGGADHNWIVNTTGTNSTVAKPFAQTLTTRIGFDSIATGATATAFAILRMDVNSIVCSGGEIEVQISLKVGSIGSGFSVRVGLSDVTSNTTPTDGVYWEYLSTTSANWTLNTRNSGAVTTLASTQAVVAGTWYRLRFVVNSTGTSVQGYINGVANPANPITTNIPIATTRASGPSLGVFNTAATARNIVVDYYWLKKTFTSAR